MLSSSDDELVTSMSITLVVTSLSLTSLSLMSMRVLTLTHRCLHCTVQRLKYSSYLGGYWLLPNLGNDWLLPVSVAIGRTPR